MEPLRDVLADAPGHRHWMEAAVGRAPAHSVLLEVQDPGLGRALTDAWLAALYCTAPGPEGAPCGACRDCRQLAGGAHPGVVPIEPDGNTIRVDAIREGILGVAGQRVEGGRFQVFVVHGAETLGEESANALLKIVEEPPPRTVFLLLTENLGAVLGTIRSRSQELVVPRPDLGAFLARLQLEPAGAAAALLVAGFSPELIARMRREGSPRPQAAPLRELVESTFPELDDAALMRDPRIAGHSPQVAASVFAGAASMLAAPADWAAHARDCHDYADLAGRAAKERAKQIRRSVKEAFGDGWKHPTLEREAAFGRKVTTHAAEDLLRSLAAVLATALRMRAGREPLGLGELVPGLPALAALPSAELLDQARRVRRARGPLRRNQNLRLAFEELFLDLYALRSAAEAAHG